MSQELIWGVDLGGSKIECAVLQHDSLEIVFRERISTESEGGAAHILARIATIVEQAKQETGRSPQILGLGSPGTLDTSSGLLKNSNTLCLNGFPLKAELESAIAIPVRIANDANCFALAESTMGVVPEQCPDAKVIFGVILGTGVGGGVVVNGQVLNGLHGIAGEWGHIALEQRGEDCYCGKQGCVEQVISGPALERYYTKLSGNHLPLSDIALIQSSDEYAAATVSHLVQMFGKGICQVINVLDPDAIVIGGGVGNLDALYKDGPAEIEKHIFNHAFHGKLLKPKLGDSAGVFGAAMLVRD